MKRLKVQKRKCKLWINILMMVLLICMEFPRDVWASAVETEMEVSENDIAPLAEPTGMEFSPESNLEIEMELESISIADYNTKINGFVNDNRWKNGTSWNGNQGPKLSSHSAGGCYAYACDFVKYMYGRNNVQEVSAYYSSNEIRTGDVIQIDKKYNNGVLVDQGHTIVVLYREGDDLYTAEGNWNYSSVRIKKYGYKVSGSSIYCYDTGKTHTFSMGYHYETINSTITDSSPLNLGDTFCAYITGASSGKVLTNDNTNVSIRTKTGASKQLWCFERQSDGTYKIFNMADLKCLDVTNNSPDSGTNVKVYLDDNNPAQKWQIYKSGDSYALSAQCTNCVLDIDNGSTNDGANVQMWEDNGTAAQKFKIQKISDTTAPTISNLKVSNITKDGYTVTGKVSDNVGVLRVSCGTWGPGHNEQNAIWESATISNGTFTYRVSFSKVKCNSGGGVKRGTYMTDIYVHDASGNSSGYNANTMHATVKVTDTLFDTTKPEVTYVSSTSVSNTQFSIRAAATDNLGVNKIEFICYAPGNTNGEKKVITAKNGEAAVTYTLSELKSGQGSYRIDVWAYDGAGNKSAVAKNCYVYVNCTAPVISETKILKMDSDVFTLQATITDSDMITKVEWITWKPGAADNESNGYVLTDTVGNQKSIVLTKTINITEINGNNPVIYGDYVTKIIAYDIFNNKREYTMIVSLKNPSASDNDNKDTVNNSNNHGGNNSSDSNHLIPSTWQGKTGTEGFVYRLYNVAMEREADESGFNDWNSQLKTRQKTAAEVARGFIFSDEFKNFQYNDVQYVKILYRTMFGREADEGGLNGWVSDLENGMSREYVYRGFVESAEFSNLCNQYGVERGSVSLGAYRDRNTGATGFIARLYTKMLGRGYDEEGLEYWCRKYHTGENTIEEVATIGFLHSQELQNLNLSDEEFVKRMYRTFLNREAEETGLQDWIGRLERGEETRDSLVYGFTNSREFANLKKEYNLP